MATPRSEILYALVCNDCGVDFVAVGGNTPRCPACRVKWLAEREERYQERLEARKETYHCRKRVTRIRFQTPGNVDYVMLRDTSPLPCLPGLPLTRWEVEDAQAWTDGTRFQRRNGAVLEWQGGELREVRG